MASIGSSVPTKAGASEVAPGPAGIIPTSQVVILKEQELDCDLATAIQRIRAREETSRSRILVVAPEPEDSPKEEAGGQPEPRVPTTLGQVARRAELAALRQLGERVEPLLDCLARFSDETRSALAELAEAIPDAARATLAERVRVLNEIREWSDAVALDLRREANAALRGMRPVDTRDLLEEMGRQVEARYPNVRVTVCSEGRTVCWGRTADLAEAFFLTLSMAAARIGRRGGILVDISTEGEFLAHRVQGQGQPYPVKAPEVATRLRGLLVDGHGGSILPDAFGPAGTGMKVLLPLRR